MFNIERWQEIFEAIAKNKLRTILTGISVASGIFILVILLGVGKGIQNGIEKQFERDADGIVEVWSGTTTMEYKGLNPGRQIQFHNADYDITVQKLGDQIDRKSSTYSFWNGEIVYGAETGTYQYRGVYPDYQVIENATVTEGRFINANDISNSEKVAVIGQKVKLDLFKEKDPIGEQIAVSKINFKVIGVFTDPGGEREESRVFLPITTTQQAYGIADKISNLAFTLVKKDNYEEALKASNKFTSEIGQLLRGKNTIAPDDLSALGVNSSIENAKQFYDLNLYKIP